MSPKEMVHSTCMLHPTSGAGRGGRGRRGGALRQPGGPCRRPAPRPFAPDGGRRAAIGWVDQVLIALILALRAKPQRVVDRRAGMVVAPAVRQRVRVCTMTAY